MTSFDPVSASRAVLVEVMNVLGTFRDEIVLVGGWVPDLLYPGRGHTGSLDVDLAVSQKALGSNAYQTILARMRNAGYTHQMTPTHFLKNVKGIERPVKVDLIGGEYQAGEKAQTIQVNELRLSTLRGLDLAFEVCRQIEISGVMPDGAQNTVRARIVQPEAFILIKAFALDERKNAKDAYDIDFVLRNHEPSVASLGHRVRPLLSGGLARDGYEILKGKFATLNSVGPTWAAAVLAEQGQDTGQSQRSAFEYAQALFEAIDSGAP